jgi:putative effector of murein hydrolase
MNLAYAKLVPTSATTRVGMDVATQAKLVPTLGAACV